MPGANHCPVCLEAKDKQFFPCGHFVCSSCETEMARRGLLSCPTCRTPREGVSRAEVEQLNISRVQEEAQPGLHVIFLTDNNADRYEEFPVQPVMHFNNLPSADPSMARLVSVLLNPTNLGHFMALRDRVLNDTPPR